MSVHGGDMVIQMKTGLCVFVLLATSWMVSAQEGRGSYECDRFKALQQQLKQAGAGRSFVATLSELYLAQARCNPEGSSDSESVFAASASLGNVAGSLGFALEKLKKGDVTTALALLGIIADAGKMPYSRMAQEYHAYVIMGMGKSQEVYGEHYPALREAALRNLKAIAEGPPPAAPDVDFSMSAMRANYYLALYKELVSNEERRQYQLHGDQIQVAVFGKVQRDCTYILEFIERLGIAYDETRFLSRCASL